MRQSTPSMLLAGRICPPTHRRRIVLQAVQKLLQARGQLARHRATGRARSLHQARQVAAGSGGRAAGGGARRAWGAADGGSAGLSCISRSSRAPRGRHCGLERAQSSGTRAGPSAAALEGSRLVSSSTLTGSAARSGQRRAGRSLPWAAATLPPLCTAAGSPPAAQAPSRCRVDPGAASTLLRLSLGQQTGRLDGRTRAHARGLSLQQAASAPAARQLLQHSQLAAGTLQAPKPPKMTAAAAAAAAASTMPLPPIGDRKLRLLCLHGYLQNAEVRAWSCCRAGLDDWPASVPASGCSDSTLGVPLRLPHAAAFLSPPTCAPACHRSSARASAA